MKTTLRLRSPADVPGAVRTARFAMVSAGYRIRDEWETAFTATKAARRAAVDRRPLVLDS